MVHGTDEWSETNAAKVKEKKTTPKNVRESKGAGSRRIFSPIFKLQVLDSYRKDADCQGNQRATARKYGIHRRQIQKWLQMETNLRLSVQQQQQQQRLSNDTSALNLSSCANGRPCDDNKESNLNSSNIVAATESKKSSSAFSNKVRKNFGRQWVSSDPERCFLTPSFLDPANIVPYVTSCPRIKFLRTACIRGYCFSLGSRRLETGFPFFENCLFPSPLRKYLRKKTYSTLLHIRTKKVVFDFGIRHSGAAPCEMVAERGTFAPSSEQAQI